MVIFAAPQNGSFNLFEQLAYLNSLTDSGTGTGGLLGIGIALISFFVVLLSTKVTGISRGYFVASLVTMFIVLILRVLLLVNDFMIVLVGINLVISIVLTLLPPANW